MRYHLAPSHNIKQRGHSSATLPSCLETDLEEQPGNNISFSNEPDEATELTICNMNEKDRVVTVVAPSLPTYQCGRTPRSSSIYSYYQGDHDMDVFGAVRSAVTPSSMHESTEHLPPRPQRSSRKRVFVCVVVVLIIALLGLIIGVVVWRVKYAATSSDNASATSMTATPTWRFNGHGPELVPSRISRTTSSESTVTITPAAFTQTVTLSKPNLTSAQ